ncbi:M48 family metalloprotease [Hydrogenovibrio sp. 3SP14C1]|uniref:M48 family metalloprotease n=1 Tax=Hydrogenovibrio sp. 3SP14C1 TaxID=3038774 RepID=UPI0024168363|nr:M48 family metalloprotease [Hydrogenovibrio sp. 3SP14C1]MDG4811842.1 M48 family metalloprotease [Hydrogenovibrio sp. 3SP14C1]
MFASNNLPDLGAPDLKDYDSHTETQLGQAFSTALHTHYDLVYDPVMLSYIRRIGDKITSETGKNRNFSFFIIDNPEINAFAGPNGVIGIHTGLIASAQSEDELASVIAHEVAHVTQRHLSRTFEYQDNVNAASIASLIAAILIGTQDPSAGIATYMGGMGLNIQQQLKNSRIYEGEADYFGIKYLNQAGYSPYAMGEFFGRLSKEMQIYEGTPPEILLTHPVTENRLAKANDRAAQLKTEEPSSYKSDTLTLIQLRLNFTTKTQTQTYNTKKLNTHESCYLKNLKQLHDQGSSTPQYDMKCLEAASKKMPKERLYKLLLAQIKTETGDRSALKDYEYLTSFYPTDFSIVYLYAQSLIKLNHKQEAIELLTKSTPTFHYQYLLYSALSKLYAEKNQKNYSYYYDALANYNIGNLPKSTFLVNQAQKITKNKNSKLYQKINQLKIELEKNSQKEQRNQPS